MSPFGRREVVTLFSAAHFSDLKCGAHSGAALNRVNTVYTWFKSLIYWRFIRIFFRSDRNAFITNSDRIGSDNFGSDFKKLPIPHSYIYTRGKESISGVASSSIIAGASPQNTTQKFIWTCAIFSISRGGQLLFTVHAEWRIMTNSAYAKSNGDGLLCSIMWHHYVSWVDLPLISKVWWFSGVDQCNEWDLRKQINEGPE
jgi:hypothetical protein